MKFYDNLIRDKIIEESRFKEPADELYGLFMLLAFKGYKFIAETLLIHRDKFGNDIIERVCHFI